MAGKVGWDPEDFLDPAELRSWAAELTDGTIHGLVLSEALHAALGLSDNYVEFQPGYLWNPYQGEPVDGALAGPGRRDP